MSPVPAARFDRPVPSGGYAWWYLDAVADGGDRAGANDRSTRSLPDRDGHQGLAIIGFVGSVFSPYYAWARRHGHPDPHDYCALNVGLYLPRGKRWSMTERPRSALQRSAAELAIGRSAMRWEGGSLRIDIDEITVPIPSRIRGTVRLHPRVVCARDFALEPEGRHRWQPIAPLADVEVVLQQPALRWRGTGYLDTNFGDAPLEQAFSRWQWTRAHLPGDVAAIDYHAEPRRGPPTSLDVRIAHDGVSVTERQRPRIALPRTAWGIARAVAVDEGTPARVVRTVESGPFYARSLLDVQLQGAPAFAMHESLSLDRFAAPWVQAMLPFRMPRARG
jgi:carotenoid 1,2-hydratase